MKSGSTRHVALSGIASGQLIIVAMDGARLLGVLFTLETARALAPPVRAMLAAWPGSADAYVYGPVCIDEAARGKGVLEALHADLVNRRPGREAILFIKANNPRSLHATPDWGWCKWRASRCTVRSSPFSAAEVDFGPRRMELVSAPDREFGPDIATGVSLYGAAPYPRSASAG